MNNNRDILLVIIIGIIAILLGVNYWDTDIDKTFECVSFFIESDEVEKVNVSIKGKYGSSVLAGERFEGRVIIGDKTYPYMFLKSDMISFSHDIDFLEEHEFELDSLISSKIKSYDNLKKFTLGYEYPDNLWYRYSYYGYVYFDENMNNIAIFVSSSYDGHTDKNIFEDSKVIVSKENKSEAMEFLNLNIPSRFE